MSLWLIFFLHNYKGLIGELAEMFTKRQELEQEIRERLGAIGYEL
jgi:hypothetical protein